MNVMTWELLRPGVTEEDLGLIPHMLDPDDPRPAREQFDANYQHGGGWRPFRAGGFVLDGNNSLRYPGDPPMRALARTVLREERILFHECAWVTIIQPDGSYEVCRMD